MILRYKIERRKNGTGGEWVPSTLNDAVKHCFIYQDDYEEFLYMLGKMMFKMSVDLNTNLYRYPYGGVQYSQKGTIRVRAEMFMETDDILLWLRNDLKVWLRYIFAKYILRRRPTRPDTTAPNPTELPPDRERRNIFGRRNWWKEENYKKEQEDY